MFGEVALRRQRPGAEELHVALHDPRRDAGGPRLPVPGRGPRLRLQEPRQHQQLAHVLRQRRLVHRRATPTSTSCPTFLGNHDMGRIGHFLQADNPGADDASCWPATGWRTSSCTSPAATPSSTTATSRASPATAATRTPGRRCSPARWRTTSTTTRSAPTGPPPQDNFVTGHPLYQAIQQLAAADRRSDPALRNGAAADALRLRAARASSRSRGSTAGTSSEYVVALNNSEHDRLRRRADVHQEGRLHEAVRRRAGRPDQPTATAACR